MEIKEIQYLLGEDKTEEAIEATITMTESLSTGLHDDAILLKARFRKCEKRKRAGINVDSVMAEINFDLVRFLDQIDEDKDNDKNGSKPLDLLRTIDLIVTQEKKEIKHYSIWRYVVIFGVCLFLGYNVLSKNIGMSSKSIPIAMINLLPLLSVWIPLKQIEKREKTIVYFDQIIRIGILKSSPEKDEYIGIVKKFIEETLIS